MNVWDAWAAHDGELIFKIDTFPDAHHAHLERFQGRPVSMLEIGVNAGGSLQLWQRYLGDQATIHGIDINPKAGAGLEPGSHRLFFGDQSDPEFLEAVAAEVGPFDIVSDDGGHEMDQQRISFEVLFPHVKDDGVYIVEDVCTSYWPDFGGSYRGPQTFVEFAKAKIDEINADFSEDGRLRPTPFTRAAASIHFYGGLIAFEKKIRNPPRYMGSIGQGVAYEDMAERRARDTARQAQPPT